MSYLWIFIGGGMGSVARFVASRFIGGLWGETFPLGTLLVNISGSLVIGFFAALSAPDGRWLVSPTMRQFIMVGICGGYTTFSSFSLQTLSLAQEGQWFRAAANVILSVVLCLVAVWLGYFLAANLNSTKGL